MNKLSVFSCLALLAMLSVQPVSAQTAPSTGAAANTPAAKPQQHALYRGSKIIGSNVRDPKDKKIGQIKDLILDGGRGEIAYAVISFGGVMGVGKKYHAVPWQALDPSEDGRFYVLHADKETINQAPGFDKARWPDMADQKWNAEIDRYWSRMVGRGTGGANSLSSGTSGVSKGAASPSESGK